MQPRKWSWFLVVALCALLPKLSAEVYDVTALGAKGDGATLDTGSIQAAIDKCAAAGGGEVRLPPGRYLTGSLQLRSGVRFHLAEKAVLLGSTSMDDYKLGPLLFANDAKAVTIEGKGEIDARGEAFWEYDKPYTGPAWRGTAQFEYRALRRPRCLHFLRCENLSLRDFTIRNSPSWTVHLQRCSGARIERLTIRNPLHGPNTDGVDINSCRDVLVDSCDIVTGDDGIVLKSTEPGRDHPSSGITISRCKVMSACNALKIGTETHSDFENIVFRDCELYCSSKRPLDRALSGVAIESVDGSNLRNIRVENITMSNLRAPFFVRLGHRGGNSEKTRQVEPRVPGTIRDVLIRNIKATHMMFESSITGIPGHPVEGIVLENLELSYEGGGERDLVEVEVPDREVIAKYPEAQMFGRLPAYGLYARNVQGLTLRNIRLAVEQPDARPALVLQDVGSSQLDSVQSEAPVGGEPLFSFRAVCGIIVRNCVAPDGAAELIRAVGEPAMQKEIRLENNHGAAKEFVFQTPEDLLARLPLFRERSPGRIEIPAADLALTTPMRVVEGAIEVPIDGGRDRGTARGRFEIPEGGTYLIKVEAIAPSGESDSFYLTVDGQEPLLSDLRTGKSWTWDFVRNRRDGKTDIRSRSEFTLESGLHLLALRNREPGVRIRALAIIRQDFSK